MTSEHNISEIRESMDHRDVPQNDTNETPEFNTRTASIQRNRTRRGQSFDGRGRSRIFTATNTSSHVSSFESHANEIVAKMEEDPDLMQNNPTSENLRKDALRIMPQCLTVKRRIKKKLLKTVQRKSKNTLSWYKRLKYRIEFKTEKFFCNFKNLMYELELWYGTLKKVEGHFGSGMATYFNFLRWLFVMNILIGIPVVAFVIIPQVLQAGFISKPIEDHFKIMDLFTGEGFFEDTILYYGFYSNSTLTMALGSYHITSAYFFTFVLVYLACFITLSISVAKSYRRSFIETEGGLKNVFAHKIFCGWDYSIATKEAADLKSSAIYRELKELLSELDKRNENSKCLINFWNITLQIVANLIILICLAIIGGGFYQLLSIHSKEKNSDSAIISAVVVNVTLLIVPAIFSIIVRYEGYKSPRTNLIVTLLRTYLLNTLILGLVMAFWMMNRDEDSCWETSLGQEVYRLIVFDFIFYVLFSTLLEICYYLINRFYRKTSSKFEFDIANHTLNAIYNQSLFWIGLIFVPLLSVIVIFKMLFIWYTRRFVVLNFCKPSSRSWRAAQTQTWFLILTFLSLTFIIAGLGYIVVRLPPSKSCGPFQSNYIYEIIIDQDTINGNVVLKYIFYLTKPGVVGLIMVALGVLVYFAKAKAEAQRDMVQMLRNMSIWQSKDKEFLLQYISKITEGRWQYNLQEGRMQDPYYKLPEFEEDSENPDDQGYGEWLNPGVAHEEFSLINDFNVPYISEVDYLEPDLRGSSCKKYT